MSEPISLSEDLFRRLVENGTEMISVLDTTGVSLYEAPASEQLGYRPEELIGRSAFDLVHPDDRTVTAAVYRRAIQNPGSLHSIQLRCRHKDGSWRYLESVSRCVPADVPGGLAVIVNSRDVTEAKRMEQQLRRPYRFLDSIVEHIPLAVFVKDVRDAFRLVLWNRASEELFGLPRAKAIGHNAYDYWPRAQADRYTADDERVVAGRCVIDIPEEPTDSPCGLRIIHTIKVPLVGEDGQISHLLCICEDITERKRAEDEVRRLNSYNQLILDSAGEGIFAVDAAGNITAVNPAATALFGYTREELIGQPLHRLLHHSREDGTAPPVESCALLAVLRDGEQRRVDDAIFWRKDGRWFLAECVSTAIRDCNRVGGAVLTCSDISMRKAAEENLRRAKEAAEAASRAKSQFLANISHEIRTPMNGILGMTQLLLLSTPLAAEQREYLELVKASADALLTVINDVLDFSKVEAGKLELDAIEFSLRDTLGDALKLLGVPAHTKGLELLYYAAPAVPDTLIGDPVRLRQVILNLAGNAIKFTEAGEVVVAVEMADGPSDPQSTVCVLRFSVHDTGCGIVADKQQLIFEPFNQADGSLTRRHGGTGLGLSIATRLVELMGGRIWVDSAAGHGSTFHFTARFEWSCQPAPSVDRSVSAPWEGACVLVVVVSATARRFLEELLSSWSLRPTAVADGAAALAELERAVCRGERYPLMVLDSLLPGMDGFALAEQVRQKPELAATALVLLARTDASGSASRCRTLGVAAHLIKPIKPSELRRAIEDVLGERSDRAAVAAPTAPTAPLGRALPVRVLLAEDNVVNQRLAVRLLERLGCSVQVVANGRQAAAACGAEPFDLVLMDVQMPELDGFEATSIIRSQERGSGRRTPIVALTAHAMAGDRERCLRCGMDDYVSKPVQPRELAEIIARWLPAQEKPATAEQQK